MKIFPGGLVVSCQALEGNPLRDSERLAYMAKAAEIGGASAIRANGVEDIAAMRRLLTIPIIGINKQKDATGRVVITPTFESARQVVEAGANAIAMDCTFCESNIREDVSVTIRRIHEELDVPVMADISNAEEAAHACAMGADLISTTLTGYMPNVGYKPEEKYTPNFALIEDILNDTRITCPVVGEGRFWTPEDLQKGLEMGLYAVVIGKAITNPMAITEYFSVAVKKAKKKGAAQ